MPYDKGTAALIADLEAAPKSFSRDEILERAKRHRYHDYDPNGYDTPKIELYKHLAGAGLHELAKRCTEGAYDQGKDEANEWARSEETQALFESLMSAAERGKPTSEPDPRARPRSDDDDQRRLRAIADDLSKLMRAYEVGGVLMLESRKSSACRFVIPKWSGLQADEASGALRLRINSRTPESREIGDATIGMIASLQDMSTDVARVFGSLFKQAKEALGGPGAIDHKPFGGKGGTGPSGTLPD